MLRFWRFSHIFFYALCAFVVFGIFAAGFWRPYFFNIGTIVRVIVFLLLFMARMITFILFITRVLMPLITMIVILAPMFTPALLVMYLWLIAKKISFGIASLLSEIFE